MQDLTHPPIARIAFTSIASRCNPPDYEMDIQNDRTALPVIETSRLVLREIVATDAPALFSIHGDADLMRWFGNDPLPNLTAAEALVQTFASWRQLPNPGTRWAIERKGEPGLIGTCGLFAWNRNWRKCIIGYELAKEAQGKGYMREALSATLTWGFDVMGLNRIEAQVHPSNLPSLELLTKLSFREEGRLRQGGYWADQYHDLLQYSLLKSDWQSSIAATREEQLPSSGRT